MKSSIVSALRRAVVLTTVLGCAAPADPAAEIGEPLPELSAAELARFRAGAALFDRVFTPEDGVGPLFNENQCSACHTSPAAGGTGDQRIVKATRFVPPAACDRLIAEGGENVRSQATPLLRAAGIERQPAPPNAQQRGAFTTTFLFGLGLIESIPDAEILRRADPADRNGDGISGRPGTDATGRLARFGRKAESPTIADFVESALHLEMGLTTPRRPHEPEVPLQPYPPGVDPAADPEISAGQVALLVDFVRFLAPPARARAPDGVSARSVERGEKLFRTIGCATCHTPVMPTGRSTTAALDRKRVHLYSDLLLHDLGAGLANVCGLTATPTELRTAPLLGLAHRRTFLHDGRAHDIVEAILFHGGEAIVVRERYRRLSELDQYALVTFLRTL